MNVSRPLSLKVSLWLLLNLLLLGAAALTFLVVQGGFGWDSLVTGGPGDRLQHMANVAAGEVAASPEVQRDAVLNRFAAEYHAQLALFRNQGDRIAGANVVVPPDVLHRLQQGPLGPPGLREPGARFGRRGPDSESSGEPVSPLAMPHADSRGRFLLHSHDGNHWWIGLRVPFPDGPTRRGPATLLIHCTSLWSVILLLNLESWLLAGAAVLALSVLFWLPLVRSITGSLRTLTRATERIAEGRFDTRIETKRRDELGRLAESVNTMAARLDTLVNGQKRFLADVAHELGSPLARLQVATEILERRVADPDRAALNDVREEVELLAKLVNEVLAFTQTGLQLRDAALKPIDVANIVGRVLAREDKASRVKQNLAAGLSVLADDALLERALANLVRNALRHAGDSAEIVVTARREAATTTLAIDDTGPGVPEAALARLGEPFFRPDLARTRETGGAGLGLAIVRTCVAGCGGSVHFSNCTPTGFRVEVTLPHP